MPWPIKNRALYASTNALYHEDGVDINLNSCRESKYLGNKSIEKDDGCEEIDL